MNVNEHSIMVKVGFRYLVNLGSALTASGEHFHPSDFSTWRSHFDCSD